MLPATANASETRFTVGNGYLGTRGTYEEGHRGELSGTYLAGVYDRHDAAVVDLVNAPDWLAFEVVVGGVRLDLQHCTVLAHERSLDLRQGLLWRRTVFSDALGRRTRLESLRLASMADRHVRGLRIAVTTENHDAGVLIRSSLDGHRRNLDRLPVYAPDTVVEPEVKWEKWARSRHLVPVGCSADDEAIALQVQTIDSEIRLAYAAATEADRPADHESTETGYDRVSQRPEYASRAGETQVVAKIVAGVNSRAGAAPGRSSTPRSGPRARFRRCARCSGRARPAGRTSRRSATSW